MAAAGRRCYGALRRHGPSFTTIVAASLMFAHSCCRQTPRALQSSYRRLTTLRISSARRSRTRTHTPVRTLGSNDVGAMLQCRQAMPCLAALATSASPTVSRHRGCRSSSCAILLLLASRRHDHATRQSIVSFASFSAPCAAIFLNTGASTALQGALASPAAAAAYMQPPNGRCVRWSCSSRVWFVPILPPLAAPRRTACAGSY